MPKVGDSKSDAIAELPLACADEAAAVEFMEKQRWEGEPGCPRCGDMDVYPMQDRKTGKRNKNFRWRCRGCKSMFTVRTGTVFEDSRIPLRIWCFAFWRACSSKKGVSALQIKRETGLSYKSALFLMHRIRYAMAPVNDSDTSPLTGTVEVDETFVGGKARFPKRRPYGLRTPPHERTRATWGRRSDKPVVFAMLERGGRVRAQVIADVKASTLREAIADNIDRSARLITDDFPSYRPIGRDYAEHQTVNHSKREYARGDITTNTVEGWFALLKRGVYGTFHNVSRAHLHRYVAEFEYRYNHRKVDDGERTVVAIQGAQGKRLQYRDYVVREQTS